MNTQGHLEDLVARYLEGNCTPEKLRELEILLLDDPGNGDYFIEMVLLDQDLAMLSGSRQRSIGSGPLPVELLLRRQRRRILKIAVLAAAAVILFSIVGLWMRMASDHAPALATFRVAPESVFELTHVEGEGKPLGDTLAEGSSLAIGHGAVELTLPNDVRAVVEGPAVMTLLDEDTLKLDRGRAFFEVRSVEGRGFTVATPHQRIVDLGTAFGVDLQPGRDGVELHVFEGRVRVDSLEGGEGETFSASRSVILTGTSVGEELEGPSAAFPQRLPDKVETLLHEDFESGLVGGRAYSIVADPTVIRDLVGNNFGGISERRPWNFHTARPVMEPVAFHDFAGEPSPGNITSQNFRFRLIQFEDGADTGISCGFEAAAKFNPANSGETAPPAEGTPAALLFLPSGIDLDDGLLTEDKEKSKWPAKLKFTGMDPGLRYDLALYGDRSGPESDGKERFTLKGAEGAENRSSTGIVSTFVTDMETRANASLGHVVRWTGIDPGADGEVAITMDPSVSGPDNHACLSAFRLAVTAPDGLPVYFNGRPFVRSENETNDGAESGTAAPLSGGAEEASDTDPPVIVSRYPAEGSSSALPGERLTLTFNRPVQLGTGRIFLRNLVDFSETEIAVGGSRTFVNDQVLTIVPPAELADGEMQPGRISGWECIKGPGIFNPGGEGMWYNHEGLRDGSKSRGVIGSMKGPNMATFGECLPGSAIRRTFATIAPDSRYTVSAAIGVRSDTGGVFDGYAMRLVSGDKVLAEFADNTPPGPPGSVTNVGFSWDSSALPEGVAPGDPLAIEIAPNHASGEVPGYLDLDNVRVTVLGKGR